MGGWQVNVGGNTSCCAGPWGWPWEHRTVRPEPTPYACTAWLYEHCTSMYIGVDLGKQHQPLAEISTPHACNTWMVSGGERILNATQSSVNNKEVHCHPCSTPAPKNNRLRSSFQSWCWGVLVPKHDACAANPCRGAPQAVHKG
jgi:hypothetical protein